MANEADEPHQNDAEEESSSKNSEEPIPKPEEDSLQPIKPKSEPAGDSSVGDHPVESSTPKADPADSPEESQDPNAELMDPHSEDVTDGSEAEIVDQDSHYSGEVEPYSKSHQAGAHPTGESDEDDEDGEGGPIKSFLEHLEDLRWTLIKSGSSLVIGMMVCLIAAPKITEVLKIPLLNSGIQTQLQLLDPLGGFMITLKLAFYTGLVIAIPFILLFVGQFVVPALKRREKKYFFVAFTIGTTFFLSGIMMCYFLLLPFSLRALVRYNKWLGFGADMWRGEAYFEFASKFMLGVGLLCEIPVLILSLIRLEVIPHSLLLKGRRYMFVVNFGICAMLTPVDLVTTMLMALALQVVYEFCILISKYWENQRQRKSTP